MRYALLLLVAMTTAAHAQSHAGQTSTRVAPRLESPSVVVLDAATGAELFAKHADDVRPIASMTKIFVAMVLRQHRLDLTKWTEITYADAKAGVGGAETLLIEGQTFQNRDLLYAMMLSSDNRVPTALARSVGIGPAELLDKIHHAAKDLGLSHTKFADSTGILGNESTAREMALALREALRDPVLARFMTTRYAKVVSRSEEITGNYTSTVQPLWDRSYKIRGGKTGHTEAAGYCLIISVELGARTVVMAFLGGKTPDARFADFAKLADWIARTPAP